MKQSRLIYFPDLPNSVPDAQDNRTSIRIYANPVTSLSTASFYIPKSQNVVLNIFDITGRLIKTLADGTVNAGVDQIAWNTEKENAGIYFLRMETENYLRTEKVSILK